MGERGKTEGVGHGEREGGREELGEREGGREGLGGREGGNRREGGREEGIVIKRYKTSESVGRE